MTQATDRQALLDTFLTEHGFNQGDILAAASRLNPTPEWAVDKARDQYTWFNDNIELLETPLGSEGDNGCWVAAWVWVEAPEEEDTEE
jgi:hypothetical protein